MQEKKNQLKEQVYRAKLRIRLGDERKKFFRNSLPILDYIFMMIDELGFEASPPYEQIQYMFEKVNVSCDKWAVFSQRLFGTLKRVKFIGDVVITRAVVLEQTSQQRVNR